MLLGRKFCSALSATRQGLTCKPHAFGESKRTFRFVRFVLATVRNQVAIGSISATMYRWNKCRPRRELVTIYFSWALKTAPLASALVSTRNSTSSTNCKDCGSSSCLLFGIGAWVGFCCRFLEKWSVPSWGVLCRAIEVRVMEYRAVFVRAHVSVASHALPVKEKWSR